MKQIHGAELLPVFRFRNIYLYQLTQYSANV